MQTIISKNKEELGREAAARGAELIQAAMVEKGKACIIVATGASQFEMLDALVKEDIDWSRVIAFHLDEYINLPMSHPASFRKYLKERFVDRVPLAEFHYIDPGTNPQAECSRLGDIIKMRSIDVAFIGIGENGHIAFNDPPADMETEKPYIVVDLDEACRKQQYGEGWFPSIEKVPEKAISMSVKQIMKSENIICSVPGSQKAEAVKNTLKPGVTEMVPASILKEHKNIYLYLDRESAGLLDR